MWGCERKCAFPERASNARSCWKIRGNISLFLYFFRWFHLCRHGGEMIIHYITPSSSLLSSTCVNLERLGGPLCAPGPPARSQILLVERNSHQLWMITIWSLTFEIIRLSKSILSMKSFQKARCMDECVPITQKSCNSVSRVKKSTLFLQSHGSWTLRALLSPP